MTLSWYRYAISCPIRHEDRQRVAPRARRQDLEIGDERADAVAHHAVVVPRVGVGREALDVAERRRRAEEAEQALFEVHARGVDAPEAEAVACAHGGAEGSIEVGWHARDGTRVVPGGAWIGRKGRFSVHGAGFVVARRSDRANEPDAGVEPGDGGSGPGEERPFSRDGGGPLVGRRVARAEGRPLLDRSIAGAAGSGASAGA
jgi:hypothetical protein